MYPYTTATLYPVQTSRETTDRRRDDEEEDFFWISKALPPTFTYIPATFLSRKTTIAAKRQVKVSLWMGGSQDLERAVLLKREFSLAPTDGVTYFLFRVANCFVSYVIPNLHHTQLYQELIASFLSDLVNSICVIVSFSLTCY